MKIHSDSFLASAAFTILLTAGCGARTITVEGIGISIRDVGQVYRYKGDHLNTSTWKSGLIFPRSETPPEVKGMEYACRDWRSHSEDTRTIDRIDRIKADAAGNLLIALPSPAAAGGGWARLHKGGKPDFQLDMATRKGPKFTPDPASPYWFYEMKYNTPGVWVALPDNPVATDHSPFVFAKDGEIRWGNPPPIPGYATVIARKNRSPVASTIANPNLLVRPNGDYLAMISNTEDGTAIYKSTDRGKSWAELANGFEVNVYSLFEHKGDLYVLGKNTGSGKGHTRIYRSTDGGKKWSSEVFEGYGGGDAPSQVDISGGRLWKAAESGHGQGFYSAPVDADLMKESSWTLSVGNYDTVTLANGQKLRPGNEGSLLKCADGTIYNLGRDRVYSPGIGWQSGITSTQPDLKDLTRTTWDPNDAGAVMAGNGTGKATVRYDAVSDQYWSITSGGFGRNALVLYSADHIGGKMGDFRFRARIADSKSSDFEGFNYPFMRFGGDDIILVSRTAWDGDLGRATRWHDGNFFTFHRYPDFRKLGEPNYLANPGFEDGMPGWYTRADGDAEADSVTAGGAHGGKFKLSHAGKSAYQVYTYKSALGIPNGSYTLRAWARHGGGGSCKMGVREYGGEAVSVEVPPSADWQKISLSPINVTSGMCEVGFYSDSPGGGWADFDDVELVRQDGFEPGGVYRIVAKHSHKALKAEAGGNVVQGAISEIEGEKWKVAPAGDGFYCIVAPGDGKGLAVAGGSKNDGANVELGEIGADRKESQWRIEAVADGWFRIVARHSGKALNVAKADEADGANVQQYGSAADFDSNELWRFVEAR